MVKKDEIIQPHIITAGPPVFKPYENSSDVEDITATAVKQNENDISALKPL